MSDLRSAGLSSTLNHHYRLCLRRLDGVRESRKLDVSHAEAGVLGRLDAVEALADDLGIRLDDDRRRQEDGS